MSSKSPARRFVMTKLNWLVENSTIQPSAALTAFREERGMQDLFSIYVQFASSSELPGVWDSAKIFALVEEMEPRLPSVGSILVITAGAKPIAKAIVTAEGVEDI